MVVQNVHQSKSRDHDRLGFHPDCPLCRQDRLFGVLSPDPNWSRRLRVLLAAGVLAVSAGATTTSVASEPDGQQEGVVAPAPGDSPLVDDGPGQGSGGDTALPFEVDPVLTTPEEGPTAEQPDAAAPLEAAPVDDPDGRLVLGDPNAPADGDSPAVDPVEGDTTDVPAPPAEPIPPGTSAPATPPSGDTGDQPAAEQTPAANPEQRPRKQRQHRKRHAARKRAHEHARAELRAASPPATSAPSTDVPALVSDARAATSAAAPAPRRIRGRFHVVLPGESLWSIASALLDAEASPAAVALEVRRLWRLNEARIGTGNPNLLRTGVRLRLR